MHKFFLISRCLELDCIASVYHFLFKSRSALLCVLSNSNTIWGSCNTSLLVQNILSQVEPFCTFATRQLILLLDCWSVLRAPCQSLSMDCHHTDSRIANTKHYHHLDVSHNVLSLHLLASTASINRCGQTFLSKTPRIHLIFFVPSTLLLLAQLL